MIENTKSASAALKVAAAGLAAGGLASTQAGAQEITPVGYGADGDLNPLIWTLEGGAIFSDYSEDKLGDSDSDIGGYGAISVRRFIEPDLDWRLTGRYGRFADNSQSFSDSSGPDFIDVFGSTEKMFANIDFDIGHHFQHPGVQGRIFVGARGLYSREAAGKGFQEFDSGDNNKFSDTDFEFESEFFGLGPRAGLEMVFKDPGDTFGISVAGSGAVILGNTREAFSGSIYIEDDGGIIEDVSGSESRNQFEALVNLSAAVGVEMMVNDNSTITVGYQVEMWTQEFLQERSLFYGPFVSGSINY